MVYSCTKYIAYTYCCVRLSIVRMIEIRLKIEMKQNLNNWNSFR